jgi:hypothetical protein
MADAIREIEVGRIIQSPYREPLYDLVPIPAAATRQVQFFQIPIGQPFTNNAALVALGFGFNKNLSVTNIQQASAAGKGHDMLITGVQVKVFGLPTLTDGSLTAGASPAFADVLGLYQFSWLELGISKPEIRVRLDQIPSGLRPEGNIYQAEAADATVLGNGMALSKEYYSFHIPFRGLQKSFGGYMFYKGDQSIICSLNFDPTFTPSAPLIIGVYLLGISNKPL